MESKISKKPETKGKLGSPKNGLKTDCHKVGKSVPSRQNGVSEKLVF